MLMMRGDDVRERQAGFDFVREHADSYVAELLAEFAAETDDELRCWLLELLAESRSERALPVFAGELESPVEDVRLWAVRGLEELDTPAARAELDRARNGSWIL